MARRNLANQRVILTGASSGIGHELAKLLAKENCRLIVNARRESKLAELVDEIRGAQGTAVAVAGDIGSAQTRERLIETAISEFAGLDIVVNNAGVGAIGEFAGAAPDRLRKIMDVNFFAPAELIREAIPHMSADRRPLIVNIGSVLGHRAVPLKSEYCASKFALHGFSDSLRAELVHQNIDVLLVSPSTTSSEFFDAVLEDSTGNNPKLMKGQSPRYVAKRTVAAMKSGRHEIILSWPGWGLVWVDRLAPWLADRIVSKFGYGK